MKTGLHAMAAKPSARGLLAWKCQGRLKESPKPVKNKDCYQMSSISEASVAVAIPKCGVVCD